LSAVSKTPSLSLIQQNYILIENNNQLFQTIHSLFNRYIDIYDIYDIYTNKQNENVPDVHENSNLTIIAIFKTIKPILKTISTMQITILVKLEELILYQIQYVKACITPRHLGIHQQRGA